MFICHQALHKQSCGFLMTTVRKLKTTPKSPSLHHVLQIVIQQDFEAAEA